MDNYGYQLTESNTPTALLAYMHAATAVFGIDLQLFLRVDTRVHMIHSPQFLP